MIFNVLAVYKDKVLRCPLVRKKNYIVTIIRIFFSWVLPNAMQGQDVALRYQDMNGQKYKKGHCKNFLNLKRKVRGTNYIFFHQIINSLIKTIFKKLTFYLKWHSPQMFKILESDYSIIRSFRKLLYLDLLADISIQQCF